jgi:hypothetical protein
MDNINKQLETINGILDRIDAKQKAINDKLDEVIKALHEYDDENNLHCEYSGLPSVKAYDEKDILSWDVDGAERRMDIIGQNGNEGLHYDSHHVTNEEADDDAKSNNSAKHVGEPKKRNKRKYYKPNQQ